MPSLRGSLVGIAAEDHLDAPDLISSSQAVPGRDRRVHHSRFAQLSHAVASVSDEFTVPLCRTHHRETIAALMKYCGGGKPEWIRLRPPPHSGLQTIHFRERKPLAVHRNRSAYCQISSLGSRIIGDYRAQAITAISMILCQQFV